MDGARGADLLLQRTIGGAGQAGFALLVGEGTAKVLAGTGGLVVGT